MNKIFIWLLVLILLVGTMSLIYWVAANSPRHSAVNEPVILADPPSTTDWVRGDLTKAKVVVVEYSDFQCPACAGFEPVVDNVLKEYGDQIALVYRHFPLDNLHKNSRAASAAAEAAGLQDKFWEMHSRLFRSQLDWANEPDPSAKFAIYAKELGLNPIRFASDSQSPLTKQAVDLDYQSGLRSQIMATPTFFVNGQKMLDLRNYNDFKLAIDHALNLN